MAEQASLPAIAWGCLQSGLLGFRVGLGLSAWARWVSGLGSERESLEFRVPGPGCLACIFSRIRPVLQTNGYLESPTILL